MLEQLLRRIVPATFSGDALNIRLVRFVALVSLIAALFSLVAAPALWLIWRHAVMAIALLVAGAIHLLVAQLIRRTGNVALASGLMMVVHPGVLLFLIYFHYGDRAIFYVWFPFVVMVSAFLLRRRVATVLFVIIISAMWGMQWLAQQGYLPSDDRIENPYAFAISLTLALIMTGVTARLLELSHRMAERRLYASEQKLRLHVDQTPLAVITMDPKGRITEWNPGAERMFGYRREEVTGRQVAEFILSHDKKQQRHVHSVWHALLDGQGGEHAIGENMTKDGREILCEWFNTVLVNEADKVVGVSSLIMDISERAQAEHALRASEARFRRLAEQSPDYIVIYDGIVEAIVYCNRSNILGYDWSDSAAPGSILSKIVEEDRERVAIGWQRMMVAPEGQDTSLIEFRAVTAQGEVEWLRSRETVLVRNAEGVPTQMLATLTVITAEKAREADLRQAKEDAEAMARARSQFLANMSHEIRTPMNGIIGMTSLLMDSEMGEQQRDFVETIRSSSEALLTIINDILDFSKIESRRMDLEMQPFDLRHCIEGALDLLAPQASDKGLELSYWIAPETPPAFVGDVTRLRQVLVNLLSNAVKFTDAGEIVVMVEGRALDSPRYELRFAVRDTGIGIRADHIPLLFSAFSQLDTSPSRRYGGTGLGLAISKRLVELMGGEMWVESREGAGSTFWFTMQAPVAEDVPATPVLSMADMGGRRLLVVDDNATNRRILQLTVAQWGMVSTVAADAQSALALSASDAPWDAVLLDMDLPDQDGLSLGQALRRAGVTAPLILLTSVTQPHISQRAQEAGFSVCLYKPLKPSDLRMALARQIGGSVEVAPRPSTLPTLDSAMGQKNPLSILLAEDNMVNQKVAQLLLNRLGYRADVAASGEEVLEALARPSAAYDVVLMDVHMPEMDGIEATRRILSSPVPPPHPYIIAMTAAAMQEDRERCRAAGMHDFISKPVQIEELRDALLRASLIVAHASEQNGT